MSEEQLQFPGIELENIVIPDINTKEKIIIYNQTNMPTHQVLDYVGAVMRLGKISGIGDKKQYCYHSGFTGGVSVSSFKNDQSHRFIIQEEHYDE